MTNYRRIMAVVYKKSRRSITFLILVDVNIDSLYIPPVSISHLMLGVPAEQGGAAW